MVGRALGIKLKDYNSAVETGEPAEKRLLCDGKGKKGEATEDIHGKSTEDKAKATIAYGGSRGWVHYKTG